MASDEIYGLDESDVATLRQLVQWWKSFRKETAAVPAKQLPQITTRVGYSSSDIPGATGDITTTGLAPGTRTATLCYFDGSVWKTMDPTVQITAQNLSSTASPGNVPLTFKRIGGAWVADTHGGESSLSVLHYNCYTNSYDVSVGSVLEIIFGPGTAVQDNEDGSVGITSAAKVYSTSDTADGSFTNGYINAFKFGKGLRLQATSTLDDHAYGCNGVIVAVNPLLRHYDCYSASINASWDFGDVSIFEFAAGIKPAVTGSAPNKVMSLSSRLGVKAVTTVADGSLTSSSSPPYVFVNNISFGAGILLQSASDSTIQDTDGLPYGCATVLVSTDGKVMVDSGDTRDYMGTKFNDTATFNANVIALVKEQTTSHKCKLGADLSSLTS